MDSSWYPYPYGSDKDLENITDKKCIFQLKNGAACGKLAGSSGYCGEHGQMRCYCGGQATHICNQSIKCDLPLCDNTSCIISHDIEKRHVKTIFE